MRSMIFNINQTFQRFLESIAQGGAAVGPQRPLNLPWTKKAPLDLFNAHRGAVPPPLGTTALDNHLRDGSECNASEFGVMLGHLRLSA
jgi:hypothetical protein